MALAWLITGSQGMLGTALQRVLTERGVRFEARSRLELDITDAEAIRREVRAFAERLEPGQRGVLVNAAAYTDVERAEDEPDLAHQVNEAGPLLLAVAALSSELGLVHVSTDFVFDGTKTGPYVETDETHPISVYGASKLAGEVAVLRLDPDALIVRPAWVFGPNGSNFPTKIIAAARARGRLSVVDDEIGSPTYTLDLARGIVGLVEAHATGLFHLAGAGSCSRFELAEEVLRLADVDVPLEAVSRTAFPTRAERPANSVLDCSKAAALGVTMRNWHASVADFVLNDLGDANGQGAAS